MRGATRGEWADRGSRRFLLSTPSAPGPIGLPEFVCLFFTAVSVAYSYKDPEQALTPAQIRAIHTVLSRNAIDDETYRWLLKNRYGVTSSKSLTRAQAGDLLDHLSGKTPIQTASRAPRRRLRREGRGTPTVVGLITTAQREFIGELVSEIHWRVEDGYARWLQANQGLNRAPATRAEAARVIEGLKHMKRQLEGRDE